MTLKTVFSNGFFRILIAVDIWFIATYVVGRVVLDAGLIDMLPTAVQLSNASSIASYAVYCKLALTGGLFALAGYHESEPFYFALATAFLVLTFDDFLEIHEAIGVAIGAHPAMPDILDLPAQAKGEVIFWALLGGPLLALMALGYLRSGPAARRIVPVMTILIGALAVCGILLDLAGAFVNTRFTGTLAEVALLLFKVLEEGGEMVIISAILVAAFLSYRKAVRKRC